MGADGTLSGIKRTPADAWFSKCVRLRANWQCEYCGNQYGPSDTGLHCSHYIGRRNKAVRWEPMNAAALCYACHNHLGGNPHIHQNWFIQRLGEQAYDILIERSNQFFKDINGAKYSKAVDREIAKHYREQFEAMEQGSTLEGYL